MDNLTNPHTLLFAKTTIHWSEKVNTDIPNVVNSSHTKIKWEDRGMHIIVKLFASKNCNIDS